MLTELYPTKLIRMGIKYTFGKSAPAKVLLKHFGLTSDDIIDCVKNG